MDLQIDIQRASSHSTIPSDENFKYWISACLEYLIGARMLSTNNGDGQQAYEVSIRIVDNDEITALNSQYRHKRSATNVLSFPAEFPDELEIPLLGDIVIAAPVIEAEAIAQGKDIGGHWAHITIHGMLHLLGYDHIDDNEAKEMETIETDIIEQLGYSPPYSETNI